MATEKDVRDWIAQRMGQRQRGRLSKGMINAWNRTHPDDQYEERSRDIHKHPWADGITDRQREYIRHMR